ncbi:ubiquitin-protein ligase [Trypanosoma brucei equiperdum]|uniref:Ubiquitin-protein ligase n=1 Tax=Trypanosoma brucei equiperdum TaxID=630700 RepID=A0A3L6L8X7_9TRYP|nr:ubiquitin-protein ligase [Trypanosoma brucei equiperdum]
MFLSLDVTPSRAPYDLLSDLCTLLIIAGDSTDVPLQPLIRAIDMALTKGSSSGDVMVMAARAIVIILDRLSGSLFSLDTRNGLDTFRKCFSTVVSMVDMQKRESLHFEKSSEGELKEEVLQCLSLSSKCCELAVVVPSTEEQIQFCLAAVDGSKRTSCKVLHHSIGLMRQKELKSATDCRALEQLVHHHLMALFHLDIDHEWDELLRTVVEGILTYRAWCAPRVLSPDRQGGKHRRGSDEGGASSSSTHITSLRNMMVTLLQIGERIAGSGTASSRVQLTLACLASVIETHLLPREACESAMLWLAQLLLRSEVRSASFSNPFNSGSDSVAVNAEQPWIDSTPTLPNLRWVVPSLLWSALVLLAKLCGANFNFQSEYIWAWRGRDDEYHLYIKKVRRRLTTMYFSAERSRIVAPGRHVIDLQTMTDNFAHGDTASRVHFQPIPCAISFDGGLAIPTRGMMLKKKVCAAVQDALRPLSFGHTQVASLARSIRFYIICSGEPTNTMDVITAFCSLPADQKEPTVGEICATLLKRDKRWASVLQEAGVADTPAAECLARDGGKKNRIESSTSEVKRGADCLREVQRSPGNVLAFLRRTSSSELLAFVQGLEKSPYGEEQMMALCEEMKKDDVLASRMRTVAQTYVLRVLHHTASCKPVGEDLAERVRSTSYTVNICSAGDRIKGKGAPRCPNGHALRVHFSVNWRCDSCAFANAFGSLACRDCNYDLCSNCVDEKLSRMETNSSAVVGDVIQSWKALKLKRSPSTSSTSSQKRKSGCSGNAGEVMLFTSSGVVPASRPVSLLEGNDVHIAPVGGECRCCIPCPPFVACSAAHNIAEHSSLRVFLHTFLATRPQRWVDTAVELSIVNALESRGEDIFLSGVSGIPSRVVLILQEVAPYISLAFKRNMAHFLAVGCCRFGLYHLQDVGVNVRGTVTGSIASNGLAFKVTVKRNTESITNTLYKVFLEYPTLRNKVEFNFEGEEGTGEGPTQELYAELSRRYRSMSELWHHRDDGVCIAFPSMQQVHAKRFFVLGASCGRAFADGYTMDISLLPVVWPLIRSQTPSVEVLWHLLEEVEPALANSYKCVLQATDAELEQMGLEDEETGEALTVSTAKFYVEKCVERRLTNAVSNLHWFARGLASVVDLDAFWFFTDDEMSAIICGFSAEDSEEKLFSEEALRAAVMEAHGYSTGSQEVETFISLVGDEFTREQQQLFIEFLTGCPQLPLNGLDGLGRKITVVRKELEGRGEQTLPSCNTCFLYFKLPPYSTRKIMKERLLVAITEGRRNFSLS